MNHVPNAQVIDHHEQAQTVHFITTCALLQRMQLTSCGVVYLEGSFIVLEQMFQHSAASFLDTLTYDQLRAALRGLHDTFPAAPTFTILEEWNHEPPDGLLGRMSVGAAWSGAALGRWAALHWSHWISAQTRGAQADAEQIDGRIGLRAL
ncbi:hypothetical protein NDU88_001321 [Pleurodeles waltl]|uniref:Uncharacterized protein n=1 Tax=Pleurodeles waltl TaxID=8319 RepID=A0AAV7WKI7_PLEWA|nr:hypothetical protein NDU88_001321 [Pleurodeles waltl]